MIFVVSRSQTKQRPCAYCRTATRFEIDLRGPRGGLSTVPCCVPCGEEPARRAKRKDAA